MSNDVKSVLAVAQQDKTPENPTEIIKDPTVLEFLGLKKSPFYEKNLEKISQTSIFEHDISYVVDNH